MKTESFSLSFLLKANNSSIELYLSTVDSNSDRKEEEEKRKIYFQIGDKRDKSLYVYENMMTYATLHPRADTLYFSFQRCTRRIMYEARKNVAFIDAPTPLRVRLNGRGKERERERAGHASPRLTTDHGN